MEGDVTGGNTNTEVVPLSKIPKDVVAYVSDVLKDPEYFKNNDISASNIVKLQESMKRFTMGVQASIIQMCNSGCESHDRCPLVLLRRAPSGRTCPIEMDLYEKHTVAYKEAIESRIEYLGSGIDISSDQIIKTLIAELVEADILELRANAMVATAGIVENVPAIVSEMGVEYRLDEATALKIKREIKKRRDINLRQLLATPEMVQRSKNVKPSDSNNDRIESTRNKVKELMAGNDITNAVTIIKDAPE